MNYVFIVFLPQDKKLIFYFPLSSSTFLISELLNFLLFCRIQLCFYDSDEDGIGQNPCYWKWKWLAGIFPCTIPDFIKLMKISRQTLI